MKGLIGGGVDATWGVVDTIAGGTAGSKMDLTAIVDADVAGVAVVNTVGRSTSGIETFNIEFRDASTAKGTLAVDTSTLAGAKNFNIVSATASASDNVNFTELAQDQMVTVKSADADLSVFLNYSDAATAGKEDVASFSLHNAKAHVVSAGEGMETVKVTATGDNDVSIINGNSATKFVIEGAGKLDAEIAGATGKIAEINASTATGSLDLTVASVNLNATGATIKGGTATDDVLNVNGDITPKMTVSGFETVGLKGGTADLTNVTGATTVANSGPSDLIVKNATGVTNLLMEGAGKDASLDEHMTLGGITFATKGATAQDALAVAINNDGVALGNTNANTEAVIKAGALTVDNVKNVTINAADADVVLADLTAGKMESLTVKATEDFSITDAVTFSKDVTVDMTGVDGKTVEIKSIAALEHAFTYNGSAATDTLTFGKIGLAANNATSGDVVINTGAGNDNVTLGNTFAAADATLTLNLGAGDDTLTLGEAVLGAAATMANQTIDFGADIDTLHFTGSKAADLSEASVTGLENIVIDAATAKLTINDETANGLTSVSAKADTTLNVAMQGTNLDVHTLTLNAATLNITGSTNNDTIIGSDYADTITGGKGEDTMTGGKGADKFVLSGGADAVGIANVDHITDFASGDKIVIDATTLSAADAFVKGVTLSGSAAFAVLGAVKTDAASVANMNEVYAQLATSLSSGEFAGSAADSAAMVARVVTFSTGEAKGSYLVINDATAGFQADADIVINITGVTGTPVIANGDFSFI